MEKGIKKEDDKVWITVSRTIRTAEYESIKVEISESITTIPTNEDPYSQDLIESMCDILIDKCNKKAKQFKKLVKPIKKL